MTEEAITDLNSQEYTVCTYSSVCIMSRPKPHDYPEKQFKGPQIKSALFHCFSNEGPCLSYYRLHWLGVSSSLCGNIVIRYNPEPFVLYSLKKWIVILHLLSLSHVWGSSVIGDEMGPGDEKVRKKCMSKIQLIYRSLERDLIQISVIPSILLLFRYEDVRAGHLIKVVSD